MKFFAKFKNGERKSKMHFSDDVPWDEVMGQFLDFLTDEGGPGYGINLNLKIKIKNQITASFEEWRAEVIKACLERPHKDED